MTKHPPTLRNGVAGESRTHIRARAHNRNRVSGKRAEVRHVEALKLGSGIGQEFRTTQSLAVVGYLLKVNCRVSR